MKLVAIYVFVAAATLVGVVSLIEGDVKRGSAGLALAYANAVLFLL